MVTIPKIIMQTWKTNDLPDKWKPSQSSIKKHMSEWGYTLMTDDMNRSFIIEYFPEFITYYDAFPYPIQRADAIRYCWLYINGGLYIDCDFELLAPLDHLFQDNYDIYLLESSNTEDTITNGFMASKPGNRLWLEMIEEMKKSPGGYAIEKHIMVMNTTGPLALNRVVKDTCIAFKLLPSDKLNPYNLCETEYNKPNVLMRPLQGSSWIGASGKMYQWCYCKINYALILVVIFLICTIVASATSW